MSEVVSVIIPVYNAVRYVGAAIESCLSQSYRNIEVVCVDDGSSDGSDKVLCKYQANENVKIIRTENRGAAAARNRALMAITGKYIQYLDADDILENDKIERQVKAIRVNGKMTLCIGCYRNIYVNSEVVEKINCTVSDGQSGLDWLLNWCNTGLSNPPSVYLLSRDLSDAVGPWDESLNYNDDTEYFARIMLAADKILPTRDATSLYLRGDSSSLGSRRTRDAYISELLALKKVTQYILNKEISTRTLEAIERVYDRLYFELFPFERQIRNEIKADLGRLSLKCGKNFYNNKSRVISDLVGWRVVKIASTVVKRKPRKQ